MNIYLHTLNRPEIVDLIQMKPMDEPIEPKNDSKNDSTNDSTNDSKNKKRLSEVNDLTDESTNKRTKTNPNTQVKDRINTEIQNLRKLINDPMTPIMIRMIVGNKLDHFNGSSDVDLIKLINLSLDHISKELKEGCFDDLIDQIQIIVERISENVLNDLKK